MDKSFQLSRLDEHENIVARRVFPLGVGLCCLLFLFQHNINNNNNRVLLAELNDPNSTSKNLTVA